MSINRNAGKASKFVVVTEQRKPPKSEQDVGTISTKAYVFEPSATLADIFGKVFEGYTGLGWSHTLDRISIYPDETTVPEDEVLASLTKRRSTTGDISFE